MVNRAKIVQALAKLGIKPKHENYSYHISKFLINEEFKIQDISKQDEAKIEKISTDFAHKVKNMYVKQFRYDFSLMLKKKVKWFSEIIENPAVSIDFCA